MLDAEVGELSEELERLCERRILRVDGTGFRFRYDLVRQVLLESISPARRELLRQRLGRLDSTGGYPDPTNLAAIGRLAAASRIAAR
jgi:hypothetical protein